MTRGEREKLSEIMGYLWAKSDDALCAGYAEEIGNMLADDEKRGVLADPPYVYVQEIGKDGRIYCGNAERKDGGSDDSD